MRKLVLVVGASSLLLPFAMAGTARADDPPPTAEAKKKTAVEDAAELVAQEDEGRAYAGTGEIVVTAEGGGVPLMYAGARDIIASDAVDKYPGANLSDVVRRVPGIYVSQTTGNEAYLNVGSRGLSPQRSRYVGFVLDGLPLALAPYGLNDKDLFPVAMERIDRIDVIRGGAALRYGSHSVGGVIDLISPDIPDVPSVVARLKLGSDGFHSEMLHAGGTWGPLGVSVIQVEKHGDGFRENSAYDIGDFYGRFRWRPTEADTLLFTIGRYMIDADLPGGVPQADYDRDRESSVRPLDDSHGDRTMYAGTWTHDFGARSRLDVTLFWQDAFSEVRISRPGSPPFNRLESKPTDASTLWGQARFTWDTKVLGMRHTFSHMLQYTHENAENDWLRVPIVAGAGPPTVTQHAKFQGRGAALFNEDVIDVTDDVQASLGLRMESIQMSSQNRVPGGPEGRTEDYTLELPSTSIAWNFAPRTAVFVGRQKSFRTPYYDNFDPAANADNEVQPELATSREIGVRTRGQWGFDASATVFRNVFTDQAIAVLQPSTGATVFENAGTTVNQGVEFGVSYDFAAASESLKGLSAYVTMTNQESEFKSGDFDGNDTPISPHHLRSWGVQYEECHGFWARADGSSASRNFAQQENFKEPSDDGIEGMNPSYTLWDLSVGWRQNPDGSGFSASVGLTNAFDEKYFYRSTQGIYASPGRAVYGTIGYTLRW